MESWRNGLTDEQTDGTDENFVCWVYHVFCLFELEFYSPANTVKVMSSWSVNLLTVFLGRVSPLTS